MENLKSKVIHGIKWSYFHDILAKLIQPITVFILAKILAPEEVGLFAMAFAFINTVTIIQDIGFGYALIQRKHDAEKASYIVFINNIVLGVVWFILIYSLSPMIGRYFGKDIVCSILRAMALHFLVFPFSSVQKNLFVKQLEFRNMFYVNLISVVCISGMSIFFAWRGYGVWSLVIGFLAGQIFSTVFVWFVFQWRPKPIYDLKISKEMLFFGSFVVMESIFYSIIEQIDNIFVGRYLGEALLGSYFVGFAIGMLPRTLIAAPLTNVLYPTFCRLQEDADSLRNCYLKYLFAASFLLIPFGVLIFVCAPYVISLLLANKWSNLSTVIQLIVINGTIVSLGASNPEFLRAIGRLDLFVRVLFFRCVIAVPLFYFAAQRGVVYVCFGHILLSIVFVSIATLVCTRKAGIRLSHVWLSIRTSIICGIVLVALTLVMERFLFLFSPFKNNAIAQLVLMMLILGSVYMGLFFALDKKIFIELREFFGFMPGT